MNEDTARGGADVVNAEIGTFFTKKKNVIFIVIFMFLIGHYPHVEAPEQVMHYLNIFWDSVAEYYSNI